MTRTLEFYYDYGSPYSYLADTQVEAIAKRAGYARMNPQQGPNRSLGKRDDNDQNRLDCR